MACVMLTGLSLPCLQEGRKQYPYLSIMYESNSLCQLDQGVRRVHTLAKHQSAEYNLLALDGGLSMPTYVYRCENCNDHLEVIQKFSDAPLKTCPKCQGHLHRVIHATGIVFKGSGWYITDSRSSSSATHTAPKEPKTETAKTESAAPSTPSSPAPSTTTD